MAVARSLLYKFCMGLPAGSTEYVVLLRGSGTAEDLDMGSYPSTSVDFSTTHLWGTVSIQWANQ